MDYQEAHLINYLFKKNLILPEDEGENNMMPEERHVELINNVFRLFQSIRSASRFASLRNIETVSIETFRLLDLCKERKDSFEDDEKIVICQGIDFLRQYLHNLEKQIVNENSETSLELIAVNLEECLREIEKDIK